MLLVSLRGFNLTPRRIVLLLVFLLLGCITFGLSAFIWASFVTFGFLAFLFSLLRGDVLTPRRIDIWCSLFRDNKLTVTQDY